jgi:hypothetical protein
VGVIALDVLAAKREKATTPTSDHTPVSTRHPCLGRGVPRSSDVVVALLRELCDGSEDVYGQRELLRLVLEHVAAGGIVTIHCGDIVLTWTDGGASRRVAAGHRA